MDAKAGRARATDPGSPPGDYGLVVPDDWFRIPLEPEEWKRSIRVLVDRVFDGKDDAAALKRAVVRDLRDRAEDGCRNGGVEIYVSTASVGPVPLSASLLVTVVPPGEQLGLVVTGRHRAQVVDDVVLPFAGAALRRRTRVVPDAGDTTGNQLPVTTVEYAVGIPGTGASLLLTFSTPLDPFAEELVGLFEAVAKSLHWR
ncbi:hypothetical protein ABZZ79_00390 [Streptomyces sp. NPDC006458]|uniref:hypothetical protein n=1 Tax=Streptomyces sp. NPDC006458 TaxID=3154302 RepID=UPI0033A63C1E